MSYTDKDMQMASQIAYMNIPEDCIDEYRRVTNDLNGYPTLEWILTLDSSR